MERLMFGFVRLRGVVRVEQKCVICDFEWFILSILVIVTLVFVKNFKAVLSVDFVLLVDVANECRDVRLCEGCFDWIGEFQVKSVVG